VKCFECEQNDLVLYSILDRQPVKGLKNRGDVCGFLMASKQACSSILNQLEATERVIRETRK
jgi:hypothetical protein